MDGRTDGQMDEQMDGWMHGWKERKFQQACLPPKLILLTTALYMSYPMHAKLEGRELVK